MDSLFRVLEPILGRNAEDRQRRPFGPLFGQRTEWFRLYKDFFIPTEALNVHFLKHKLAVVCAKGFEIMDLTEYVLTRFGLGYVLMLAQSQRGVHSRL